MPIVILVLGVLLVCIIAILSFSISSSSVENSFSSINTVVEAGLIREKISLYENLGYNEEQIKTFLDLQEDVDGNLIIKQFGTTVVFTWP